MDLPGQHKVLQLLRQPYFRFSFRWYVDDIDLSSFSFNGRTRYGMWRCGYCQTNTLNVKMLKTSVANAKVILNFMKNKMAHPN